jgi:hypothetical protein
LVRQDINDVNVHREYRTFAHVGASYHISEAQCWRIVTTLERWLLKSRLFHVPGKRKLTQRDMEWEVAIVDVSEHPIERPKKTTAVLFRKKLHANSELPKRNHQRNPLTRQEKKQNCQISSERVLVENVIRKVKIFRIMAEKYRNRRKRFGLRLHLICGILNYEL